MDDPITIIIVTAGALFALTILAVTGLKGWRGWLELQRATLAGMNAAPSPGGRIELADLKERVRKLEAIAAGVDL